MKVYIIWKTSISGWSKEIDAIFLNEINAKTYLNNIKEETQYNYRLDEKTTKD
ncbi:hypothetical protein [Lederbergia lenta]|uniref:hypothetical protein n=1 Tax=Lederbergia lenta TaxID=1467 RepID=UPI00203F63E8|nr:hypothetical protein [Lederbergia lenta]MCM3113617.1 hypothetical protein [Lederbergia lenta]